MSLQGYDLERSDRFAGIECRVGRASVFERGEAAELPERIYAADAANFLIEDFGLSG